MARCNKHEVALAVENFGHFAKVCKVYGEKEELEKMFGLTFQIAEKYCAGYLNFCMYFCIHLDNSCSSLGASFML